MTYMSRRELLVAGAVTVSASALRSTMAAAALESHPLGVDPMSLVDTDLRPPLEQLLKVNGPFKVSASTLVQARKPWITEKPAPTPPFETRTIAGPKGAPDVRVIVINARPAELRRPVILHMHGGGFVLGAAGDAVPALQRVALEHDCVIVTVDYRLAPETRFPGSLEDNYAALKWVHESAESLGADRQRIAVMGESAGGGHAAMLAIATRDRGEVPLAFQLLIYPMLDDRTGSTRQLPWYLGAYIWVPESNRFGWSSLLGVPAGSRVVPPGAVPARVQSLAGLSPAFIGVGSVDLFVDEDIEYARRLISAGVATQLVVVPGAYHGFDNIAAQASASKQFRAAWNAALAKAFAPKAGS
jgi:acetyl esterase/lipase